MTLYGYARVSVREPEDKNLDLQVERLTNWSAPAAPWATSEPRRPAAGPRTTAAAAGNPTAIPARKPTFLQKERWKAIQKARRKGMSLRAIERELGIHRATIKKYMDAEGLPTRQTRAVVAATPSSDTIQASPSDISPELRHPTGPTSHRP